MKKLLSVVLVLAMMLSLGAVQVFAADADTKVYLEYDGADVAFGDGTKRPSGTSMDIDYYEVDAFAPITDADKATLEVGKVYKVVYVYTFNEVAEPGWELKFMPTEEYYYNITNGDVWKGEADTKTVVAVPFKVTSTADVKLKNWQHGGLKSGSTLDKVMVVGADFNAYSIEGVDIVMEGVANAGNNQDAPKPADNEWTPSDANAVVDDTNKDDTNKDDTNKDDSNKTDTNKDDSNKTDTNKDDTNKTDTNKGDTNTGDTNKGDTNTGDTNKGDDGKDDTKVPQTADVSVMLAVVAAGAAAFGGLKLRKK